MSYEEHPLLLMESERELVHIHHALDEDFRGFRVDGEVAGAAAQHFRPIDRTAEHTIALRAQQPADPACRVIVVYRQRLGQRLRARFADGAAATLSGQPLGVLGSADPVFAAQVSFPLCRGVCILGALRRVVSVPVLLAPGIHLRLAAFFAPGSVTTALVATECRQRLLLVARSAGFHSMLSITQRTKTSAAEALMALP